MSEFYAVVEKDNTSIIHCIVGSLERGQEWIDIYGDSENFTDKTLSKDSFTVVPFDYNVR